MKKLNIYIIFVFLTLGVLSSCYKDLSTKATISLPDIEISSQEENLNLYYGETFVFTPEVTVEGRNEDELTYKWEMTLTPRNSDFGLEIGNEKTLTYFVGNTPSSTPYFIKLTVTDTKTTLYRSMVWNAYVASSLGEGLLVAHTADNGETTELSLLTAKPITYGYTGNPKTIHNLYTLANGGPIQGRVNSLSTTVETNLSTYNTTRVYIGTNENLISVNYLDYKEDKRNASLFHFYDKTNVKVEKVFNYASYAKGLLSEGYFYGCICNSDHLYSQIRYMNQPSNIITTKTLTTGKITSNVSLFDESRGKFYYFAGWHTASTFNEMQLSFSYPIVGATSIACGLMKANKFGYVIKSTDGNYYATVITSDGMSSDAVHYNISEIASDIADAKGFAFCDNADFFYYYTDRNINAIISAGSSAVKRSLTWSPDSVDEKITDLFQYTQAWYGTQQISIGQYEHTINTNRLQMVIVTYNEKTKEGKIYLRPYNLSTGLFTMISNGTYGGFNEITAIATTLR